MEWYGWVAIAAILTFGIIVVAGTLSGPRHPRSPETERALTANAESNARIAERLDAIDARLAAIEKTLNDIP